MKKNLFIVFFFLCVFGFNLKAQDTLSHWSFGVKAGLDYFRVTPVSSMSGINNYIDDMGWTAPGVFLEYTINPLLGFGGNAEYFTFNRNTARGNTLDFTAYGSVNLSNLLVPERKGSWNKLNVYGDWGAGLGFYSNEVYSTNEKNNLMSPLVTSTLNVDYRLNNAWALNMEAHFRYYFREDLGGINSSGNTGAMVFGNDAFAATIGLRYKFGAKDKKHVRNICIGDYYNKPDKDDQAIQNRLKAIEDENAANKDKMQKMEAELKNLKDEKAAAELKLQNDLKNIPQAQVNVNSASDTITVLLDVNFEFGSYKLQPNAKAILDETALVLKMNKTWSKLLVSGHTDSVGGEKINQKLSEERANVVKNYLISKGISASAIQAAGFGKDHPKAPNTTDEGRYINRRAELVITK